MSDTEWTGVARPWLDSMRKAVFALAMALVTPAAFAHVIVVSSQPAAHAVVPAGELAVRLQFSGRIDRARSRLALIGPDGAQVPVPITGDDAHGTVTATTHAMATGDFRLHWQVLSLDGHVTRGDVPFRVDASSRAR